MAWTRGATIGRGSSARVSLATTDAGHVFAVKSADVSSSSLLQNELNLISQLCSPFVIKCFGSEITLENDKSICNIFLEYVSGGTLADLIRSQGGSLPENTIQFYANQLLKGLSYIHKNGFVHCDIKGQNILIGDDGLKIADFGCAKRAECGCSGFAGTPAYMAPEVARGEEQSFPADVWALGCTVIEMATGSNPWPGMKDPASALYRIAFSDDSPEIPTWFSDAARDFVARCLMKDPRERWTVDELLQHPFFDSAMTCTKKSPTSVTDQHFWDTVEVSDSESSPDPSENDSGSDSPAERMRGLIGEADALNFAEWAEEGDWVTVRANECRTDDQDLINSGEEIEMVEDLIMNSFIDSDGISRIDFSISEAMFSESEIDDWASTVVSFCQMATNIFFDSHFSFYCNLFRVNSFLF